MFGSIVVRLVRYNRSEKHFGKDRTMDKRYLDACMSDGTSALKTTSRGLVLIEGGESAKSASAAQIKHERVVAPYQPFSLRQLIVFAAAFAVVAAVLMSVYSLRMAAIEDSVDASLNQVQTETVSVKSGDSLWSLAAQHGVTGVSTADVAHHIQKINGLSDTTLKPGEVLKVPFARH